MKYPELERAIDIIAKLRDPENGCPWDLKQSHKSLTKYLIEESYEYIHAVDEGSPSKMEEEMGDVLLQILLNSQIASESNQFNIDSVAKVLADKLVIRHPHIFGDVDVEDAEEVLKNWKKIKNEGRENDYHIRMEDAYAPSLTASHTIGAKSQEVNFDWDCIEDVWAKVEEELEEVKIEIKAQNHTKLKDEIGDLLFSITQYARHAGIDAEEALKEANIKFVNRINKVEDIVKGRGEKMADLPTAELEKVWQSVKKLNQPTTL